MLTTAPQSTSRAAKVAITCSAWGTFHIDRTVDRKVPIGSTRSAIIFKVLRDISMSVEPGNVISIIGPSGSGKSTLLRCSTFLETADGGDILYDGQYALQGGVYASKAELAAFRKRFGLVFQSFNLFPHYSVMRNLTEPPILHGEDRKSTV